MYNRFFARPNPPEIAKTEPQGIPWVPIVALGAIAAGFFYFQSWCPRPGENTGIFGSPWWCGTPRRADGTLVTEPSVEGQRRAAMPSLRLDTNGTLSEQQAVTAEELRRLNPDNSSMEFYLRYRPALAGQSDQAVALAIDAEYQQRYPNGWHD